MVFPFRALKEAVPSAGGFCRSWVSGYNRSQNALAAN
jgi:hypothetical protein